MNLRRERKKSFRENEIYGTFGFSATWQLVCAPNRFMSGKKRDLKEEEDKRCVCGRIRKLGVKSLFNFHNALLHEVLA